MDSQFQTLYEEKVILAKAWKEKGGRVLGYFNSLTPEELIYAADILPVEILGTQRTITESRKYLPKFLCTFLKDCLEQALSGDLDYLDGIVMAHACEAMRGFFGVWKQNIRLPSFFLQVPATSEDDAKDYFHQELLVLKDFLEKLSGKTITSERLRHAIHLYNENRKLMKELYEIRKKPGAPFSGSVLIDVIKAGLVIPKEDHNGMVRKLIENYRPQESSKGSEIRLFVMSNALDEAKTIIDVIETSGARVVSDNFCFGLRYCWEPVALDADPLLSLADHYLKKIPCPGKYPMARMANQLTEMVKEARADGVVWTIEKYCDPFLFESPFLLDRLREEGIHVLSVEAEEAGNIGRLKTKIEAFIEIFQHE
jgi:benzoyl-CoA reductase subunit C